MKPKHIFLTVLLIAMSISLMAQVPEILARWDFGSSSTSPQLTPNEGIGTITNTPPNYLIGGATYMISGSPGNGQGGSGARLATQNNPTSALNTGTGLEVLVSTTGYENIILTWHGIASAAGANRSRVQYTTDGSTWIEFPAVGGDGGNAENINTSNEDAGFAQHILNGVTYYLYKNSNNTWDARLADFSSISGVNNNPNFGVRFLTAFDETTGTYVRASGASGEVSGNISFDNITFKGVASTDPGTVTPPTITTPTAPVGGVYLETITVTIASATADAEIYYTLSGADPDDNSTPYTAPLSVSATTTVKAIAYKTGLTTSTISTVVFTFPTPVASIYALRALAYDPAVTYQITGDVVVTRSMTNRNQKFIQDVATAANIGGLLIDDNSNVGVEIYNAGDIIPGNSIIGRVTLYGAVNNVGLLQFTPSVAMGASTTTETLTPLVVTLAQLNADPLAYQCRYVKVEDVTFVNATTNYTIGTIYTLGHGTDTFEFRGHFTGSASTDNDMPDYLVTATPMPSGYVTITGHIYTGSYGNPSVQHHFLNAPNLASIVASSYAEPLPPTDLSATFSGLNVTIHWSCASQTILQGFNVFRSTTGGAIETDTFTKQNGDNLISASDREYLQSNLTYGEYWYYVQAVYTIAGTGTVTEDSEVLAVNHIELKKLFFSEYIEGGSGSGNTKAIEIYNPYSVAVDLDGYVLKYANNGAAWSAPLDLGAISGSTEHRTLPSHEVLVVYNTYMQSFIDTLPSSVLVLGLDGAPLNFNGDDGLGLFYGSTLIDAIGYVGPDVGNGFTIGGVTDATMDKNLIRKSTVTVGNDGVWETSAGTTPETAEWEIYDWNTYQTARTLGKHPGGFEAPEALTPAPRNLTATATDNTVALSWAAPALEFTLATTNEEEWYVGADSPIQYGTYTVVHRYTPTMLAEMGVAGQSLTSVSFITNNTALEFTVKVWTGGSYEAGVYDPGTPAITPQAVTNVVNSDWTTVTLTTAVTIPTDAELWIGYGATVSAVGYIAGADDSDTPAMNGFGNLLYFDSAAMPQLSGWYTLSGLQAMLQLPDVMHCSWMIKGGFAPGAGFTYTPPASYNIYHKLAGAGSYGAVLTNVTGLSYTHNGVANGDHNYIVKAVYAGAVESGASNEVEVTVDYTTSDVALTPPPRNLSALVVDNAVNLSWVAPAPTVSHAIANDDEWYIGIDQAFLQGTFTMVQRFTPAMLAERGLAGGTLTGVSFIASSADIPMTVLVWTGGSYTDPSTMNPGTEAEAATVTAVTAIPYQWTDVTLTTPVNVPTNAELWIGYRGTLTTAGYIAGVDDNTVSQDLNGFGNIIHYSPTYSPGLAAWYTLASLQQELQITPVYRNWMIRGTFTPGPGFTFTPPTGYNVYRKLSTAGAYGDALLTDFDGLTYNNTNVANGSYHYIVKAIYDADPDDIESAASNRVTAEVDFTPSVTYTVTGTVTFAQAGYTPDTATVTLENAGGVTFGPAPVTVATGAFSIAEVPAGAYGVTVSFTLDGDTRSYSPENFTVGEGATTLNITVPQSASDDDTVFVPVVTALRANYPNPFNPTTTVVFDMARAGHVSLEVYNVKGQLVRVLANGGYDAGRHSVVWNGDDLSGRSVGSGVYFYRMTTEGYSTVRKMLLMK